MKVCFVVDNLNAQLGGWGRMATNVAYSMARQGHEVGFVATSGESDHPVLHVPLRQPVLNLKAILHYFLLPATLLKIRKFVRTYDVVICYDPNPYGILISLATLGLPVKIVMYAVGTYSLLTKNPVTNLFIRWAYAHADRIFITSEFVQGEIKKSGLTIDDYVIAPVGLDPNVFKVDPTSPRVVEGEYLLGVGALKRRKGFHISIPAFAKIASEFPNLQYVVVGDQRQTARFENLKQTAKELGVEDRVVFLERLTDEELLGLYNHAKLFVLIPLTSPDALEGFGMVFLEANACGLPVVGAYNSGAEAAIVDGLNGLLAQPEPDDVARALSQILRDPALAKRLSEGGLTRVKEFHWDRIGDLFIKECEALVTHTS